jgi:hypothetical protein
MTIQAVLVTGAALLVACSSSSSSSSSGSSDGAGAARADGGSDASVPIGPVGRADGGGRSDSGGSTDAPVSGGTALAKLCNTLTLMGSAFTISVDVGDVAPVRLSATTGDCSSPLGEMCQAIPAGMQTLTFFADDQMAGTAQATLTDGEEIVLVAALNATNQPTIRLSHVSRQGLTCAAYDAFAVPDGGAAPGDAGSGDAAPAGDERRDGAARDAR